MVPAAAGTARVIKLKELKRREIAYRGDRPEPDVKGKTVILVDDGLATGSTIRDAATSSSTAVSSKPTFI